MMMDTEFTVSDLLAVLRRRWLLIVAPLAIGSSLAMAVAFLLPPVYESTARILVESARIPDDLARSTVGQSAEERIQLIRQRLLTRQTMLEIADQHGVFRGGRRQLSPTEIVDRMRESTRIESMAGVAAVRGNRATMGVTITFGAESPTVAAQVANELVSRILQQNVRERTERATGTLTFFTQEVQRLGRELDAQTARITSFKRDNAGALPETLALRQSELTLLRDRRFARSARLVALEEERRALRERIEIGRGSAGPALTPEQQELQQARSALIAQRSVLSETHPTIRQLTARVAALEAAIDGAPPQTGARGVAMEMMARVDALDAEIALLQQQDEAEAARIDALEQSLAMTPSVQMALEGLERTLATLETQFRDAVLKQAQAQTGERLEANQQAERFEVIEQAIAAEQPSWPNRPLIAGAGVFASGMLGVALATLAEMLNRSVRSAHDFERRLRIRPIVAVPYIRTQREVAVRRWRTRILAALAILGAPAALFAIDQFHTPLPLLVEQIVQRLRLDVILSRIGG